MKTRVLFICVHNAFRSQIAEAYLNALGGDTFEAESAGMKATEVNPLAIEAMAEEGIDISHKKAHSVFDYFKEGRFYGYVIAVCSDKENEGCPIFPGMSQRLSWSFDDPSKFTGTTEERLEQIRKVRDQIKEKIEAFIKVTQ